jgi:hypothetical protein
MKNKIAFGGIILLAMLFAFPALALTDEERLKMSTEPVSSDLAKSAENPQDNIGGAPIHIHNITTPNQNGNKFNVEFDLDNGKYYQQGLKFSISLNKVNKVNGQEVTGEKVYEKVYQETFSMGANQKDHKNVEFIAPDYLSGQYQLWVEVHAEKGMALGMMVAKDKVTLRESGKFIHILPESCFLYVNGDQNTKHRQGIDLSPEEKLNLSCEAENTFDEAVSAIPRLEILDRSLFGKSEDIKKADAISFESKEKKKIDFEFPKMAQSQAYVATLSFRDSSDEKDISNRIVSRYLIRGPSATVQNYGLDKGEYKAGENAVLRVYATASNGISSETKKEEIKAEEYVFEGMIADSSNNQCSGVASQNVKIENNTQWEITLPVSIDCPGAKAVISIKDKDGKILDKNNGSVLASDAKLNYEIKKKRYSKIILFAFLILIVLIVAKLIIKKIRLKNFIFSKVVLLFLIPALAMGSYFSVKEAQAFSGRFIFVILYYSPSLIFNYVSDKDIYGRGEQMTIVAWPESAYGYAIGSIGSKLTGTINGQTKTFFDADASALYSNMYNYDAGYRFTQTFTAPSSDGSYSAYFVGSPKTGDPTRDYNWQTYVESTSYYTVMATPTTSCAVVTPDPARQRGGETSKIFLNFNGTEPKSNGWLNYTIRYYGEARWWYNSWSGGYWLYGEDNIVYDSGHITDSSHNYPYSFQWPDINLTTGRKDYTVQACREDGICTSVISCSFNLDVIPNNPPVSSCPAMNPSDPLSRGQTTQLTMTATDADKDPITYRLGYCSYPYSSNEAYPTGYIYCNDWDNLVNQGYNSGPLTNSSQNYRNVTSTKPYNNMDGIMHLYYSAEDDHGGKWEKYCELQVGSQKVTLTDCPYTDTSHSWIYAPEVGTEIPMSRPGTYPMRTTADIRGAADDPDFDSANRYGMKFYFDWDRNGVFEQTYDARAGMTDYFWYEYTMPGYSHNVPQGVTFYNIKVCDRNNTCSNTRSCYVAAYNDPPYASPTCPTVSPSGTLNINETGTFNFSTRNSNHILYDPDGDYIKYFVNWGDGSAVEDSGSLRYDWNINFRPTHSWNSGGTKTYTWYGIDGVGGTSPTYSCTVNVQQPTVAVCGNAINNTYCSTAPSSNLCVNNTNSPSVTVDANNPKKYIWTCSNSSGSVDCSATKYCSTDAVWREVE